MTWRPVAEGGSLVPLNATTRLGCLLPEASLLYNFMCLFLIFGCAGSSLLRRPLFSCGEQGLLSTVEHRLLIVVASLFGL